MDIETVCREALKSFPGAVLVYLGRVPWAQLKEELGASTLRYATLHPENVRVLHDPALGPGDLEVVRVPDVWTKADERKPRKRTSKKRRGS